MVGKLFKENKKKFEAQGLKHEFFGKNGNQWTYKGADLCVGIGRHNKKCDNKTYSVLVKIKMEVVFIKLMLSLKQQKI